MFSRPTTNAAAHHVTGYSARIVTARAWLSKKSNDTGAASGPTKSQSPSISRDQVATTSEDIEMINRSAHHYQERDLEHDELGLKDPHHLHRRGEKEVTWKDAEEEEERRRRGGDGEVRKLPDH
jgi:hypothetical protein